MLGFPGRSALLWSEPLLRKAADHEIRTTIALNEVVTTILRLVDA